MLERARIDLSRARFVAFTCADQVDVDGEIAPYGVSIPLERALAGDVLIAWALNGEPLAPEHGAPMRIIVPDYAGVRSAKWIERIEVRDTPSQAPIQAKDYKLFPASVKKDDADWDEGLTIEAMPVTSAICAPERGEALQAGRTRLEGYAAAYGRSGWRASMYRPTAGLPGARPSFDPIRKRARRGRCGRSTSTCRAERTSWW